MIIRSDELAMDGPVGSIFLPKNTELTLSELGKRKFEVMLLRGAGRELTLEEQVAIYDEIIAAEESIHAKRAQLGGVALSHPL